MSRFVVACLIAGAMTVHIVWSQPDVYVIDQSHDEIRISVIPRERSDELTVDAFAYLYLPDYKSYSPLEGVRVFVASLGGTQSVRCSSCETNADGFVRLTLNPYEPVNLLFQFDKALRIGERTEVDHLMPLTTFVAGRPGQAMSVHVAMATVRDVMKMYGPHVFKELYDLAKLAVGNRRELLSGAWQDVISICWDENRDDLIDDLTETYGNELELACSDLKRDVRQVPGPGERFRDCAECPWMIVVPGGTFTMGSPASERGRLGPEGPRHRVRIGSPFAVGVYEVTFAEWDACVLGGGCDWTPSDESWGRGRRPVINVSWEDTQRYVGWLSRITGEEYRLLSESEWEYVARAPPDGTSVQANPFHFGSTISTDQANYNGNYTYGSGSKGEFRDKTIEVGSFRPNSFGLYDVHGNVWEWTQDCWNVTYVNAPTDGSSWEDNNACSMRVLRGGSWWDKPWALRSAIRAWRSPTDRTEFDGFRVARTLAP